MDAQTTTTACVKSAALFQHALMEEPPTSAASADDRRHYLMMSRKLANLCADCPLMRQCLYRAVVEHDVSGFVAGTTARQRQAIRDRLGISVAPEDFDTLAGVVAPNRQVDGAEVVRLRNANPHESLETLAHRLGCSLSTVKRHLRRARAEAGRPTAVAPRRPTLAEVLEAYHQVLAPGGAGTRRAA